MYNSRVKYAKLRGAINSRVEFTRSGCWKFGNNSSYAIIYFEGKGLRAHRASYEAHHEKRVPKNCYVLHSCSKKYCVNPTHLVVAPPGNKRVVSWFAKNNLSLQKFATRVGVSYDTAYRWVKSKNRRPIQLMRERIKSAFPDCPLAR